MAEQAEKLRIDKWLWHARFYKTRSLASKACQSGHIVLNGQSVSKASVTIVVGDRLQFFQGPHLRVVEIMALGQRRGPAPEAQTLYADHPQLNLLLDSGYHALALSLLQERQRKGSRPDSLRLVVPIHQRAKNSLTWR